MLIMLALMTMVAMEVPVRVVGDSVEGWNQLLLAMATAMRLQGLDPALIMAFTKSFHSR